MSDARKSLAQILETDQQALLEDWLANIRALPGSRTAQLITEQQLRTQAAGLLRALTSAFASEQYEDIGRPEFAESVARLREISASRARQGFTPSETATFVLSLKDTLLRFLQDEVGDDPALLNAVVVKTSKVIDKLGLATFETFATTREEVITQQKEEIISLQRRSLMELSTPVMVLWDELILLPLVGVIDTARARQMMEKLLDSIVANQARVAILDVTGVPAIDTKVAQHVVKAVSAARMLGAEVVVTGISPDAAQTLTKLDIDLSSLRTAGSLRAGIAEALAITGKSISGRERGTAMRIPILQLKDILLTSVQVDLTDQDALGFQDDVLRRVGATEAKGVVIDITALEVVDSFMARVLNDTANMARLLGTAVIVCGMQPSVALTLTEMGRELMGVATALNLEHGLEEVQRLVASRAGGPVEGGGGAAHD